MPIFPVIVTTDPFPGVRRMAEVRMDSLDELPQVMESARQFCSTVAGGGMTVKYEVGGKAVMHIYEPYPPDHPKFHDVRYSLLMDKPV